MELDPTNHVFLSNRSACYLAMSNWEKAAEDAAKAAWLAKVDAMHAAPAAQVAPIEFVQAASKNAPQETWLVQILEREMRYYEGQDYCTRKQKGSIDLTRAEEVQQVAQRGVDLQLSGHTHGGQMWPFHYAVELAQPALAGLSEVDGTQLYVTRGAGFWGPPVRIGAPPDISVLTLRSDSV